MRVIKHEKRCGIAMERVAIVDKIIAAVSGIKTDKTRQKQAMTGVTARRMLSASQNFPSTERLPEGTEFFLFKIKGKF